MERPQLEKPCFRFQTATILVQILQQLEFPKCSCDEDEFCAGSNGVIGFVHTFVSLAVETFAFAYGEALYKMIWLMKIFEIGGTYAVVCNCAAI